MRVRQPGEEGDHRVHHVLVVDDAVLTLANQNANKLAEVVAELLPHRPGHGERIISAVLLTKTEGSERPYHPLSKLFGSNLCAGKVKVQVLLYK